MELKSMIADLVGAGLTQSEIARRVGISQPFVSELAAGEKSCAWETGEAIRKLHRRTCKARKPPTQQTQEG